MPRAAALAACAEVTTDVTAYTKADVFQPGSSPDRCGSTTTAIPYSPRTPQGRPHVDTERCGETADWHSDGYMV